jgi:hypothetical protein
MIRVNLILLLIKQILRYLKGTIDLGLALHNLLLIILLPTRLLIGLVIRIHIAILQVFVCFLVTI